MGINIDIAVTPSTTPFLPTPLSPPFTHHHYYHLSLTTATTFSPTTTHHLQQQLSTSTCHYCYCATIPPT
jgi:hypothetical protein